MHPLNRWAEVSELVKRMVDDGEKPGQGRVVQLLAAGDIVAAALIDLESKMTKTEWVMEKLNKANWSLAESLTEYMERVRELDEKEEEEATDRVS